MDTTSGTPANGGGRVAHAHSPRGEVALSRRDGDGALELRVNGVFVMDTVHTRTERMLATSTLRCLDPRAHDVRVLVGGLGLGFTLHEVLADPRVGRVCVAEIEPAVLDWYRRGLVAELGADRDDQRLRLHCGDVTDAVAASAGASWDVILLDVDNGPGYLVHDDNAGIYRRRFLTECDRALAAGGVVAVWSADAAPELAATMREVFAGSEELAVPVTLGTVATTYHLFVGRAGRTG